MEFCSFLALGFFYLTIKIPSPSGLILLFQPYTTHYKEKNLGPTLQSSLPQTYQFPSLRKDKIIMFPFINFYFSLDHLEGLPLPQGLN